MTKTDNTTKIVVFDLDETLGYFTEFGIFCDCLDRYFEKQTYSSINFNKLLDLYPEFLRPKILNILNYLKEKKKEKKCYKVMIYTNNQGPKDYKNPKKDLNDMRKKDKAVMDAFEESNPEKTLNEAKNTSVCGPQTITTLMLTCKNLGATKCEALKYYMSYEKGGGTGPCEYSVGYFSGIISK